MRTTEKGVAGRLVMTVERGQQAPLEGPPRGVGAQAPLPLLLLHPQLLVMPIYNRRRWIWTATRLYAPLQARAPLKGVGNPVLYPLSRTTPSDTKRATRLYTRPG